MKKLTEVRIPFADRLITEKEAAQFLGLAPITLRMQRCQGVKPGGLPHVPFIKLGKSVRYSLADLREMVDSSRVEG